MPDNEIERSPEDRRDIPPSHQTIIDRLDRLEGLVEPFLATWEDVAAVGRIGRTLTKMVLWGGGIAAAVVAFIQAAKHTKGL